MHAVKESDCFSNAVMCIHHNHLSALSTCWSWLGSNVCYALWNMTLEVAAFFFWNGKTKRAGEKKCMRVCLYGNRMMSVVCPALHMI